MSLQAFTFTTNMWTKLKLPRPFQGLSVGRRWHQYFWQDANHQFVLEAAPDQNLYYMTTQKEGVSPGDYVEISGLGNSSCYQIIQLERYCDPPDMWIATLREMTQSLEYGQT